MDEKDVTSLLESVRSGSMDIDTALGRLKTMPFVRSGDVSIDSHRSLRRGLPEVIFAPGKSDDQLIAAIGASVDTGDTCLVTRVSNDQASLIDSELSQFDPRHHPKAGMVVIRQGPVDDIGRGTILVITAGASDAPVAEEAAVTCESLGNRVDRAFDIGVAGIHRLLSQIHAIQAASVIIAVAGMEGALPGVVAGLAPCPVVAVPTSIGYGASFGGIAALLSMLNSCAGGVTVVNIDNGLGAGLAATLMNRHRNFDETTPMG